MEEERDVIPSLPVAETEQPIREILGGMKALNLKGGSEVPWMSALLL